MRFVVTNRAEAAAEVFAWNNRRGEAENCIKDPNNGLHADRLSCHVYRANAFRFQLHVLAYALQLLKVAARVRHSVPRLWVRLATGWPGPPLFELLQARAHAVKLRVRYQLIAPLSRIPTVNFRE